jgi:ribosomal protein L11
LPFDFSKCALFILNFMPNRKNFFFNFKISVRIVIKQKRQFHGRNTKGETGLILRKRLKFTKNQNNASAFCTARNNFKRSIYDFERNVHI